MSLPTAFHGSVSSSITLCTSLPTPKTTVFINTGNMMESAAKISLSVMTTDAQATSNKNRDR